MNPQKIHPQTKDGLYPKTHLKVYAALLILLALTVGSSYLKLDAWNAVLNFTIAAAKAILIGLVYMSLHRSTALTRVFAVIGLTWLLVFISLILADYLHR